MSIQIFRTRAVDDLILFLWVRPVLVLLLALLPLVSSAGPSFKCGKNLSKAEQEICRNEALWQPDKDLAADYRAFYRKLPSEKQQLAKSLQRLWIGSREARCFGRTYAFKLEPEIPADLRNSAYTDPKDCLLEYYWFASESLKRGLQTVSIFMEQGKNVYEVGIGPIDRLVVEKLPGERHTSVFINAPTQKNRVGSIEVDEFGQSITSEIRIYLTRLGELVFAAKHIEESTDYNARCGQAVSVGLGFYGYNPDQGVRGYEVGRGGIYLVDESFSCSSGYSRVQQWGYEPGKGLVFTHLGQSSHMFQVLFPEKYRVVVSPSQAKSWREEVSNYTDKYDFKSAVASGLGSTSDGRIFRDADAIYYKTDAICSDVFKGIWNYFALKSYAVREKMSTYEALKYARDHVGRLKVEDIRDLGRVSRTTTEVFLRYLDKLRTLKDWESRMRKLASDYGQGPVTEIKQGLYSEHSCMASTPPPRGGADSLEDWIYLFWARRLKDGTLQQSEDILRQVLNVIGK